MTLFSGTIFLLRIVSLQLCQGANWVLVHFSTSLLSLQLLGLFGRPALTTVLVVPNCYISKWSGSFEYMAWILLNKCVTRQVCVFPNNFQSSQFLPNMQKIKDIWRKSSSVRGKGSKYFFQCLCQYYSFSCITNCFKSKATKPPHCTLYSHLDLGGWT